MCKGRTGRVILFAFATLFLLATVGFAAEANDGLINWALGATYTYSMDPHESYPDSGGELTNGVYGEAIFSDPAWVGHLRNDFRVITVDLGQARTIQKIKANFLQQWNVGARYPQEVIAEVSKDGVIWEEVGFQTFAPHRMDMENGISQPAVFDVFNLEARYVRITVLVDIWLFLDEIEVLG